MNFLTNTAVNLEFNPMAFVENLKYMHDQIVGLDEVSIGHALICDALYLGLEETIKRYLDCLK